MRRGKLDVGLRVYIYFFFHSERWWGSEEKQWDSEYKRNNEGEEKNNADEDGEGEKIYYKNWREGKHDTKWRWDKTTVDIHFSWIEDEDM